LAMNWTVVLIWLPLAGAETVTWADRDIPQTNTRRRAYFCKSVLQPQR
jgi:hypothetical protein